MRACLLLSTFAVVVATLPVLGRSGPGDRPLPETVAEVGDWTLSVAHDPSLPLRIVDVAYDFEEQELTFRLENIGEQPVTAWTVGVRTAIDGNAPIGTTRSKIDAFEREAGWIRPGGDQDVRWKMPKARALIPVTRLETVVSVDVSVFEDTSYMGLAETAASIFEERGATWRAASYWVDLIETARAEVDSPESAAGVFTALDESMSAKLAGHRAETFFESRLQDNLRRIREHVREHPEKALGALDAVLGDLRATREASRRATPSAFLGAPAPPDKKTRSEARIQDKAGCTWLAVDTTKTVGSTVDETWNFACGPLAPSGMGSLHATGTLGCSPRFEGDDAEGRTLAPGEARSWSRRALSQTFQVISLSCSPVGDVEESSHSCSCPGTSPDGPLDQREGPNSPITLE